MFPVYRNIIGFCILSQDLDKFTVYIYVYIYNISIYTSIYISIYTYSRFFYSFFNNCLHIQSCFLQIKTVVFLTFQSLGHFFVFLALLHGYTLIFKEVIKGISSTCLPFPFHIGVSGPQLEFSLRSAPISIPQS